MTLGIFNPPKPHNEPIFSYAPESCERAKLKEEIERLKENPIEVPLIINGKEIKTDNVADMRSPHDHTVKLGIYHKASKDHVKMALEGTLKAQRQWMALPWEERASVFLKAADLLAGPYRYKFNAATMLGQSKTPYQSEIDAVCELIDFFRFNVHYMKEIMSDQPPENAPNNWNRLEYRPLEGFIFAITPFNFTSIAANLPTAPAMFGNVAVWKPSQYSIYSAYFIMELLKEAGLPDGVINMIPGDSSEIADMILDHPELAGVHFTGSTRVFQTIWKRIGNNLGDDVYKNYPRIVGETGGKDFVIANNDADIRSLAVSLVRGAFEYQGQKCSAASRAYIPESIWPAVREEMKGMINDFKVGDVTDFSTFMGAVISRSSYQKCESYIDHARESGEAEIIIGGKCDDSKGYFVSPTVIKTTNPNYKSMEEEIFGPILTVYVFDDSKLDETLELLDQTSPYALTGAIFAKDRYVIKKMADRLCNCAGNFYINDKPTGAVVGQQPFGGGRASGTNDKAGSYLNLLRWLNVRTIKENFIPVTEYRYPHMD